MKVSVVIAAWNERENVELLLAGLVGALTALDGWRWEIVFVVEGDDGTRELLEAASARERRIAVLYADVPRGLGAAFRLGFSRVAPDADFVATMDADLNHDPAELPRLLGAAVSSGADVLVGSRFRRGSSVRGTPLWKRALSRTMNVAMRFLYGLEVRDKTSGYRVYRARALRSLEYRNDDFAFLPELLIHAHRSGLRLVEEPIAFTYRVRGASKMGIVRTTRSYLCLLRDRGSR